MEGLSSWSRERGGRGLVEEDVQERLLFRGEQSHLTVPLVAGVGSRRLAGLLAASNSLRTGPRPRPRTCSLAAFLPRIRPATRPTRRPGPRAALPGARRPVPVRSFRLESRQVADITGSPVPPAPDKAPAP